MIDRWCYVSVIISLLLICSCGGIDIGRGERLLESGSFAEAREWSDQVKNHSEKESLEWRVADSIVDIADRIEREFSISEDAVVESLKSKYPDYSESLKRKWEDSNLLESRVIDGNRRYFNRAVSNLGLLLDARKGAIKETSLERFALSNSEKIISYIDNFGGVADSIDYTISFTLTVDKDAVPDGELIRCWIPYPKSIHKRQSNIKLLTTSQELYQISSEESDHRSIYFEKRAEEGKETQFNVRYSYTAWSQYFNLDSVKVKPYKKKTKLYKTYTAEQHPHIEFSPEIKRLADSIVGDSKDPRDIVKKIYYWISDNIPWAGAIEYGVIPNIPEYVLKNMKGDCGMQTLLFISMARYKGVPAKWQSGWMLHPGNKNLHDWNEVYYEGVGWVPVDVSFHLQSSDNKKLKEFYISGMDSYRLIVNDGIGAKFEPQKNHFRSEPWDFQRGEVEWRGGNIYFDQWDYNLKIEKR